jgi:hypothetical protein
VQLTDAGHTSSTAAACAHIRQPHRQVRQIRHHQHLPPTVLIHCWFGVGHAVRIIGTHARLNGYQAAEVTAGLTYLQTCPLCL